MMNLSIHPMSCLARKRASRICWEEGSSAAQPEQAPPSCRARWLPLTHQLASLHARDRLQQRREVSSSTAQVTAGCLTHARWLCVLQLFPSCLNNARGNNRSMPGKSHVKRQYLLNIKQGLIFAYAERVYK